MEIMSILKLLYSHIYFSDVALTLYGLVLFRAIVQKFTTKAPMIWPLFGVVPQIFLNYNSLYDWVTKSLIKAGGTFYFRGVALSGTYGIITVNPSIVEYVLKTNFKNFPKGKNYRERFFDLLGDGIFNADDDMWKQQRRAATFEMYSNQFVEYSLNSIRDLVHNKLLKVMESVANSNSCIDLQEVLLRFTFDNICGTAFGVDSGCLALDLPDVPFAKAFEEATEASYLRFSVPPFCWKPMKFLGIGSEKRLKEAIRVVHDFAETTVIERKIEMLKNTGEFNDRCDLLTRLIKIQQTNQENGLKGYFSDSLLKDFCISFILAGRDTSSVGLAWFFWLIHNNPLVETKILDEIKRIIAKRKSHGEISQLVFKEDELKQMVYLQAALSESLRLYPPVPVDFKEVLEDDLLPDGTLIKSGNRVLYSIYSMGRIESIWGEDCYEFKPERWIKDGEFVSENQFKYVAFNGGPRLCVGKKFAYMQMKMVAASVLLRYSVEVVEGQTICPKLTTTLYMKNGLMVNLKPRVD